MLPWDVAGWIAGTNAEWRTPIALTAGQLHKPVTPLEYGSIGDPSLELIVRLACPMGLRKMSGDRRHRGCIMKSIARSGLVLAAAIAGNMFAHQKVDGREAGGRRR
jgi:hypothetical protein